MYYTGSLIRLPPVLCVHGVCLEADKQHIKSRKFVLSFQKLNSIIYIAPSSGENLKLAKLIVSIQKPAIKGFILMFLLANFKIAVVPRCLNSVHFMRLWAPYNKELRHAQAAMEHCSLKQRQLINFRLL